MPGLPLMYLQTLIFLVEKYIKQKWSKYRCLWCSWKYLCPLSKTSVRYSSLPSVILIALYYFQWLLWKTVKCNWTIKRSWLIVSKALEWSISITLPYPLLFNTFTFRFFNERQKFVLGTEILSIATHVRRQKLVNIKT